MVSANINVNVNMNVMQVYTQQISMANVNMNIMQLYTRIGTDFENRLRTRAGAALFS